MSFPLLPKVTLNAVMALILPCFTEFGSFRSAVRKSGWRCHHKKSSHSLSHLLMSSLFKMLAICHLGFLKNWFFKTVRTVQTVSMCHRAKLVAIGWTVAEIWQFVDFSKCWPSAILDFKKWSLIVYRLKTAKIEIRPAIAELWRFSSFYRATQLC